MSKFTLHRSFNSIPSGLNDELFEVVLSTRESGVGWPFMAADLLGIIASKDETVLISIISIIEKREIEVSFEDYPAVAVLLASQGDFIEPSLKRLDSSEDLGLRTLSQLARNEINRGKE